MKKHNAHLLAGSALCVLGLVSLGSGCELITGVDRSQINEGTGGTGGQGGMGGMGGMATGGMGGMGGQGGMATGGMGGMGGTGGTGGMGGQGGTGGGNVCVTPADCPDTPMDCMQATCESGACGMANVALGTACTQGGGKVCDANGACVECNVGADCASGVCTGGVCQSPLCNDGQTNGNETDVDCGGGACPPCNNGQSCLADGDCDKGFCNPMTMKCAAPNCNDGFKNMFETDVDCGGPSCVDCMDGQSCVVDGDCLSGFCNPMTMKCAMPTCMDGVKNGDETGIDCGGATCGACVGASCAADGDCASKMCYGGACVASVNGCDVATATDMTASNTTTVTFANGNFTYAPKCLKVKAGTVVTFNGSFTNHPLQGGEVTGGMEVPSATGPFATETNMGMTADFTMSAAGTFPYYCVPHGVSFNMTGAVFVVP